MALGLRSCLTKPSSPVFTIPRRSFASRRASPRNLRLPLFLSKMLHRLLVKKLSPLNLGKHEQESSAEVRLRVSPFSASEPLSPTRSAPNYLFFHRSCAASVQFLRTLQQNLAFCGGGTESKQRAWITRSFPESRPDSSDDWRTTLTAQVSYLQGVSSYYLEYNRYTFVAGYLGSPNDGET